MQNFVVELGLRKLYVRWNYISGHNIKYYESFYFRLQRKSDLVLKMRQTQVEGLHMAFSPSKPSKSLPKSPTSGSSSAGTVLPVRDAWKEASERGARG